MLSSLVWQLTCGRSQPCQRWVITLLSSQSLLVFAFDRGLTCFSKSHIYSTFLFCYNITFIQQLLVYGLLWSNIKQSILSSDVTQAGNVRIPGADGFSLTGQALTKVSVRTHPVKCGDKIVGSQWVAHSRFSRGVFCTPLQTKLWVSSHKQNVHLLRVYRTLHAGPVLCQTQLIWLCLMIDQTVALQQTVMNS